MTDLFQKPGLQSVDIEHTLEHKQIYESVISTVNSLYKVQHISELDLLSADRFAAKNIDLRSCHENNLYVDNLLRRVLADLVPSSSFIQYPFNIRLFQHHRPHNLAGKAYTTDLIHCDHWSGSPVDSTNFFYYLKCSSHTPYLQFYQYKKNDQRVVDSYRGSYSGSPSIMYKPLPIAYKSGQIDIFSCKTPHQTIRRGTESLISIDFRVRPRSEIFRDDINLSDEAWNSTKMTSLGVYWSFTPVQFASISDKISFELESAAAVSDRYLNRRREYLTKYYSEFMG